MWNPYKNSHGNRGIHDDRQRPAFHYRHLARLWILATRPVEVHGHATKRSCTTPTGPTILIFLAVLFVNLFGAALSISRRFFLKNTGRKLSHLDKQFNVSHADMPAPASEEDFN